MWHVHTVERVSEIGLRVDFHGLCTEFCFADLLAISLIRVILSWDFVLAIILLCED